MRILQLISSSGFYGAENVVIELSKKLKNRGIFNIIGCIINSKNGNIDLIDNAIDLDLPYVSFDCKGFLDTMVVAELKNYMDINHINVIHSHNYKSNFFALISTFNRTTRLISTCHNWSSKSFRMRIYEGIDKLLLRYFNRIVSVSEPVRKQLIYSGINSKKTFIVNNGIDLDKFKYKLSKVSAKEKLGIPNDCRVVGTVGRLVPEKGHIFMIESAKVILKSFPKTFFLIVGDGPLLHDLKNKSIGLPILFSGFRNDIANIYSSMDFFILPSLTEGLPMVLLEAMASQVPVIATKVGSIPNIIENNINGIIIPPANSDILADSVLFLMKNNNLAASFAKNGYNTVLINYSSSIMANEYINHYMEVLK